MVTVAADFKQDLLDEVAAEWAEHKWPGAQLLCDVRDKADCARVVAEVEKRFGRIDVLVNNAGVAGGGPVDALSPRRCGTPTSTPTSRAPS